MEPVSYTHLDVYKRQPQESIGVQALSIRMAYQLCKSEPELLKELQLILENADTEYYSTGVKTTIRNILKKINK